MLAIIFLLKEIPFSTAWADELAKEIDPERANDAERAKAMETALRAQEGKTKNKDLNTAIQQLSNKEASVKEVAVEDLQQQDYRDLLRRPKKDRFHFGYDTDMTYTTNRSGAAIHYEKGNTVFRVNPSASIDLSKRKTDMKLEYRWNRTYNDKTSITPGSDNFGQEISFRAGHKIFRKLSLSLNDRLSRNSVRVQGFDNKKVSFDNSHRQSLSYEYNPKLTLNLETSVNSTAFVNENWTPGDSHDWQIDPNLSFQLTRKTRITAGYRMSNPRSYAKSSDATNHVFRFGYSGKITPKSTVSADFSWTIQDPASAQASRSKKYSTSASYLWQATAKTGIRLIYSNSYSLTISDSLSGRDLFKTSNYSSSNSWGISIRFRPYRRINTEFSFTPSHSDSRTKKTGDANTKSRNFTFPIQAGLDLEIWKGIRLRLTYTYKHKIGDEMKTDENRTHTWFAGTNVLF